MSKYIIQAFDYNGKFYGYFAPHPDDKKNESFSYYVDEIKDAKIFNSYEDALRMIERFQEGSDLEYSIRPVYPDEMNIKISKVIKDWVKEHYGESEANDPSWNIEELADHLAKSIGTIQKGE